MTSKNSSLTVTHDAQITQLGEDIYNRDGYSYIDGVLTLNGFTDKISGELRGNLGRIRSTLKSALAQLGLDMILNTNDAEIQQREASFWMELRSYADNNGNNEVTYPKNLLSYISDLFREGKRIDIARLLIQIDEHISADELNNLIGKKLIWLPDSSSINDDGTIDFKLEDVEYLLVSEFVKQSKLVEDALTRGRRGLSYMQVERSEGLRTSLHATDLLIGGIKFSIAPGFMLELYAETNIPNLIHLNALALDGGKTTGSQKPWQVELAHRGDISVNTADIIVKGRLFRTADNGNVSKEFVSSHSDRIHKYGINMSDVLNLHDVEKRGKLLSRVDDPFKNQQGVYALVISPDGSYEIPISSESNAQPRVIDAYVRHVIGELKPRSESSNDLIDKMSRDMKYVGGDQRKKELLVSKQTPDVSTLRTMFEHGIGGILFKDLLIRDEMYRGPSETRSTHMYFDNDSYTHFCDLSANGFQFYFDIGEEAGFRAFHKGFWVKPEDVERIDKVKTVLAMYGTHKDNVITDALRTDLDGFMKRMQRVFGEEFAVIHGNGPGMMLASDEAAENNNITRLGVGINVEKIGQAPNMRPQGIVAFEDKDRLRRQKLIDDISLFKIFNVGGGGTLEEIAISLCSQKLGNTLISPMIFIDSFGLGENGGNIWELLKEQIEVLAQTKKITIPEKDNAIVNLQLLSAHSGNYCHVVSSYNEAAGVLEDFVTGKVRENDDEDLKPTVDGIVKYYQKLYFYTYGEFDQRTWDLFLNNEIIKGYDSSKAVSRETGFDKTMGISREGLLEKLVYKNFSQEE